MTNQSATESPAEAWQAHIGTIGVGGDRAWASAAAGADRRLRRRAGLAALAAAAFSAASVFTYCQLASGRGNYGLVNATAAAVVAAAATILAAASFHFALRKQYGWLLEATSLVARHNIDLFMVLGKLAELRNRETACHSLRVALYTVMFAEYLDFSPGSVVRMAKGALLHDIGKFAIPDQVLNKPGSLTVEERAIIQTHVTSGLAVVAQSAVLAEAAPIVAAHHERYDGGGYPMGLSGVDIPCEARLFALADVFDALTSDRPYRSALSVEEALDVMLADRGTHFEPTMLDRFIELVPSIAKQLPQEEQALAAMLTAKLQPYLEHFIFVTMPAGSVGLERPVNDGLNTQYAP